MIESANSTCADGNTHFTEKYISEVEKALLCLFNWQGAPFIRYFVDKSIRRIILNCAEEARVLAGK